MKKNSSHFFAIMIIVFLGVLLQKNYINEFPSYIHAWAQSDRYALAKGFINNNFNFFKPETLVLNHQFPDDWEVPSKESITAVDFPIHDYIPAIFMKLSGISSPWIFRVYIMLFSFIGLFFLFKIAMLFTNHFFKSIFVVIFASTSPVFAYYQNGFLPTIPSMAIAFIGIYYYTKYLASHKKNQFNLSILFLTLAALSRTTFAIPLIAVLGLEFIRIFKQRTLILPKIIPVLTSISVLLFYFFYNTFLREKYGSIFLNHILPATSIQEAYDICKIVIKNFLYQYFSIYHYIIFIFLIGISSYMIAIKKTKISKESFTVLFLTIIIFIGCSVFTLLMLRQFPSHDYYFLDTFFLPIMLFLIFIISSISPIKTKWINGINLVVLLIVSIPLVVNAHSSQKAKRITGEWDRTNSTINNFKDTERYLDSLKIPQNSNMLVIDGYAPNIPFILMNRKGYVVMTTSKENISESLTWDYDYIVMQNEFFLSDIYLNYPEIISKTEKVWDNGRISISKLRKVELKQSLDAYLGLSNMNPILKEKMDFDTVTSKNWQNINPTTKFKFSGQNSGFLTQNMEYGLTYKTKDLPEIKEKGRLIFFQSYFLHHSNCNVEVIVSIIENDKTLYYKTFNLQDLLKEKNVWEKVNLIFQLPKVNNNNYEFSLFIWNKGKTELFIDDFEFKLF